MAAAPVRGECSGGGQGEGGVGRREEDAGEEIRERCEEEWKLVSFGFSLPSPRFRSAKF